MTTLLLFALLLSKDTIITSLVPKTPASSSASTTLRLLNTATTPLKNIVLDWELQVNGAITKKGKTPIPALAPQKPLLVHLPLRLPDDTAGESFLQLRYHSTAAFLGEQQLLLKPYRPGLTIAPTGEITLTGDDDIFTIHSPSIRISFNRQTGWLVHYEIRGTDLLDDTLGLRSNFWSPGYNDSASYATDSGWLAATREPHLQLFSNTTSPELIIIRTEYTLPRHRLPAPSQLHHQRGRRDAYHPTSRTGYFPTTNPPMANALLRHAVGPSLRLRLDHRLWAPRHLSRPATDTRHLRSRRPHNRDLHNRDPHRYPLVDDHR